MFVRRKSHRFSIHANASFGVVLTRQYFEKRYLIRAGHWPRVALTAAFLIAHSLPSNQFPRNLFTPHVVHHRLIYGIRTPKWLLINVRRLRVLRELHFNALASVFPKCFGQGITATCGPLIFKLTIANVTGQNPGTDERRFSSTRPAKLNQSAQSRNDPGVGNREGSS